MSHHDEIAINACGVDGPLEPTALSSATLSSAALAWALRPLPADREKRPPMLADEADWLDPRVGWGLVLKDPGNLVPGRRDHARDAPKPIRDLLEARGGVVLRYGAPDFTAAERLSYLRNYEDQTKVALERAPRGVGHSSLPTYLLIYGSPEQVPWDLQMVLNASRAVGRLELEGAALKRYVKCLLDGFAGPEADPLGADPQVAVLWAVALGQEITGLMRDLIAAELHAAFANDGELASTFLDGRVNKARAGDLIATLAAKRPGLIVTTSHGLTGPLGDPESLLTKLGLPVDHFHRPLDLDALFSVWQPAGAIWYAHACCSAGTVSPSFLAELFDPGTSFRKTLDGLAALGNRVAPLAQRLLGAEKPARAFIGHIEPTFDWTLRDPRANVSFAEPIKSALYDRLFQPMPLGMAWRQVYEAVGAIYGQLALAQRDFDAGRVDAKTLLRLGLTARDLLGTMIIGDPVVSLA